MNSLDTRALALDPKRIAQAIIHFKTAIGVRCDMSIKLISTPKANGLTLLTKLGLKSIHRLDDITAISVIRVKLTRNPEKSFPGTDPTYIRKHNATVRHVRYILNSERKYDEEVQRFMRIHRDDRVMSAAIFRFA